MKDGMKTLRVAVVGLGGMGQGHCKRIVEKVPEMRLAAVCDAHAPTAEKVGAEMKVPHFTAYKDLIAAKCCDAAIVATPHPLHPVISIACMEAGLHVLTEKPVSERIGTAETMVKTAERKGVTLGVIFQQRFAGPNMKAIEIMKSGVLGQIHRVTAIIPDYRTQAYYNAGGWRATWAGEGGGVLLNQSPHMVDLLVQLVGLPKSVRGRTQTFMHDIEVEDLADAFLTYSGGGIGYIYCSTIEPQSGTGVQFTIAGENGKLILADGGVRLFKYPKGISAFTRETTEMWAKFGAEEVALDYKKEWPAHEAAMQNFARHILFGEEFKCSARSGLGQLELANAILLSSWTDKELDLPIDRNLYEKLIDERCAKSRLHTKMQREDIRLTDPSFTKK
jgi:predicted dehydrogenase